MNKRKNQNAKSAAALPWGRRTRSNVISINTRVDLVKDSIMWSSYKERIEDALALRGDEGRDRLL